MASINFRRYLFLGMGLIGGSIARSIRSFQPDAYMSAYVRHPETLSGALSDGVLNAIAKSLTSDVTDADVIILCAPTRSNIENLKAIAPLVKDDTLLTDVGSVKHDIQEMADSLGLSHHFLGGHPMTGRETTGYNSSDARILENAYYILTPSKETKPEYVETMTELVKKMRALPLISDPVYHDYATAAISHVPHLIAASLVTMVKNEDNEAQFMKTIAAGGFKDITRIASSDPDMWASISQSNRDNIRTILQHYIRALENINAYLQKDDYDSIRELFRESGEYRGSMNDRKTTAIPRDYRLYVDIPDETGQIAKVAGLLARSGVSIRNIGITHNREQSEGPLYIAFYDEPSMNSAIPLLQQNDYHVILK